MSQIKSARLGVALGGISEARTSCIIILFLDALWQESKKSSSNQCLQGRAKGGFQGFQETPIEIVNIASKAKASIFSLFTNTE